MPPRDAQDKVYMTRCIKGSENWIRGEVRTIKSGSKELVWSNKKMGATSVLSFFLGDPQCQQNGCLFETCNRNWFLGKASSQLAKQYFSCCWQKWVYLAQNYEDLQKTIPWIKREIDLCVFYHSFKQENGHPYNRKARIFSFVDKNFAFFCQYRALIFLS